MVMHARKQPRLNDGYADRKDAHLHQDMQYHSSLFANDSDDDRPISSRVSPRYQNKSSYIERNKEKRGSLSLAEEKVSHYLATGSLGRPISLESSFSMPGGEQSGGGGMDRSSSSSHRDRSASQSGGGGGGSHRDYNSHSKYSGGEHRASSSSYHPHSSAAEQQPSKGSSYQQGGDANSHPERDKAPSATNNGKQSTSSKEHGKDKEQVQKSAIRVCGDWSEHISSSGKRYYYNCKSEVSQWEKPKEWNSEMCKTPDHRSKDGRPKTLASANKISDNRASRHSSSSEHHERAHGHRGNNTDSGDPQHRGETPSSVVRNDLHSSQHGNREHSRDSHMSRENSRDNNSGSRDPHKSNMDRGRLAESSSTNSYHHHSGMSRSGSTPGNEDSQHMDYKRSQTEGHVSSSQHGDYKRTGVESSRRRRADSQTSQRYHDTGQVPIDDMDISPSPSPSPSSSRPSSVTGTPQMPATSTPIATATTPAHNANSTPGGQRAASPQGCPIPTLVNRQAVTEGGNYDKSKTIQTLQELQKALSMHIHRAQQSTTSQGPVVPGAGLLSTPMATPMSASSLISLHPSTFPSGLLPMGPQGQPMMPTALGEENVGGRASPVSDTSSQSSCGSPTPSDSSSQNAAVNSQALTAAAMKREETAKLTASLSNYYNEKLIGHVLGWQADGVEKQALKHWEESMMMGSHQCSKVSVELKRARSQVRIAEIQSTLHEQRIMSSDQQRQEIENLKTPSSFLPS
ncbi:WW domain-containing adapter protein with coiled-coil isoform X2 [Aplysia californica]|uniref:WW domain-containing adapter protein with coiled-coil isoform X2 n=1 Tax=Aplysia californica TaxID=6500 RepID=A0ABM0JL72_APLCA|nr:WW domain-containing adapter protein with coiled-coil isoform X2 [Aplysia californica]